jgi:hypothetical protein
LASIYYLDLPCGKNGSRALETLALQGQPQVLGQVMAPVLACVVALDLRLLIVVVAVGQIRQFAGHLESQPSLLILGHAFSLAFQLVQGAYFQWPCVQPLQVPALAICQM